VANVAAAAANLVQVEIALAAQIAATAGTGLYGSGAATHLVRTWSQSLSKAECNDVGA